MTKTKEELLTLIEKQLESENLKESLTLETDLTKVIDSFGLFDLILEIEAEFGVDVDLEAIVLDSGLTADGIYTAIKQNHKHNEIY